MSIIWIYNSYHILIYNEEQGFKIIRINKTEWYIMV
jgi:hypothetical protein